MNRKTVTIGALAASSLALSVLVLSVSPASATAPASARYGVVNATVNAATDHEVAASSAFPNYTNGAVDNYYSMAHTHIDNSPFAEGTASPADSGPVGQTAASQASYQQPQYADARWPGAESGRTASVGSSGGPSAFATAANYKATALSTEASANGTPGGTMRLAAPKGFNRRLHLVLAVWEAQWLGILHLKPRFASAVLPTLPTVPVPTLPGVTTPTLPGVTIPTPGGTTTTTKSTTTSTSPGTPDNGGLVSTSLAELDPKSGAVITSGESRLGRVTFGGGQIVLKNIDVSVKITNSGKLKGKGKPTGKASVKVGGATVGGVPVTIDQNGVHVDKQGSGLPYGQASAALNTALKQAGVEMHTVQPQIKKSKNELMIDAPGVIVSFSQPVQQSGVPSQNVQHILGEVFADSLASPAPPVPKLNLGGPGSLPSAGGGGNGTGVSGGGGSSAGGSQSGSGSGTGTGTTTVTSPSAFQTLLNKPLWLLIAYLVWQTIVAATGVTVWRWKMGPAT